MDNNFNIPPNSPAFDMASIMQHSEKFIEKIKTGEGLGLTEEQKEKFNSEMKKSGGEEAIAELKDKMDKLRDAIGNFKKAQEDNNKS